MKPGFNKWATRWGVAGLLAASLHVQAFSLLGPYEPWMEETNGLRQPADSQLVGLTLPEDIGGPMPLNSGYRWNVPVVTFGFDPSFLNYFGTNGVAAVNAAVSILNALPPASCLSPTNYPFNTGHLNYDAQAQNLVDLKSVTLAALLEQMGLTQPTRYTYVLKKWDASLLPPSPDQVSSPLTWPPGTIPQYIVQRNYDPQTVARTTYVNSILYSVFIYYSGPVYVNGPIYSVGNGSQSLVPFSLDPDDLPYSAVADFNLEAGEYLTGLTYDDVGGLAYLLSTNWINYESLLAGVSGTGTNYQSFVNGAWRPGVDKITFQPQPVDPVTGAFLPTTNCFTDNYVTNGVVMQQQLARVISQPDILFTVADLGFLYSTPQIRRTGTTNWINNASLNANTNGAGPGVIQPGITITFNKTGRNLTHDQPEPDEAADDDQSGSQWGSFDGTTNAPIVHPITQTGTNLETVRMWLFLKPVYSTPQQFIWSPASGMGTTYNFETSTDLQNWATSFSVTNDGSVNTYINAFPSSQNRFYRLVPTPQ